LSSCTFYHKIVYESRIQETKTGNLPGFQLKRENKFYGALPWRETLENEQDTSQTPLQG